IGIGAGPDCDGQVLVLHDVLGLSDMALKFTKHYADLRGAAIRATEAYVSEVRNGTWPDDEHSFH
ncbi:MAG: 3-methyl-2-oxobutanoate hydroxymethyltransferase, partial [Actinomycetota bacterium]